MTDRNTMKSSPQRQTKLKGWELGKITVFLIAGKIDSGKTTLANVLAQVLDRKHSGVVINAMSFGYYVKDVAYEAFGWDGEKDSKGRKLLQVVGTEAGREYDPDIWVRRAYEDLLDMFPPNFVIFDDWRFPNEYEYFLDKPEIGRVIKIRSFRDEEITSDHISEKSLPSLEVVPDYYDYRFDNNCSMGELPERVEEMLEELL